MPAHKKKTTTSTNSEATSTVSSAEPLTPETFHQYLRTEIRHATRLVMENLEPVTIRVGDRLEIRRAGDRRIEKRAIARRLID